MEADWGRALAPSLDDITDIAEEAFARLPDAFRKLVQDVTIRVQDFPEDEVLANLEAETEFDLLGLFTGVAIGGRMGGDLPPGLLPNMVFLYRRPILDYWAENEETLDAVVTHVLVHEIGHHFGLSDEDMERIEAGAS
jgi:predicted Zn-dependent protease with MMP-like domain